MATVVGNVFSALSIFLLLTIATLFGTNALSDSIPPADTQPPDTILPSLLEESFDCPTMYVTRHAVPGSCTRYHFCFGGSHQIRDCGDGLHFDDWLMQCTFRETARCTRDLCPPTNDIENIVYFPSTSHCEEYFMCFNGRLTLFLCAVGIHWDQSTNKCQRPEIAQCDIPSTTWPTWPPTTWPPGTTWPQEQHQDDG